MQPRSVKQFSMKRQCGSGEFTQPKCCGDFFRAVGEISVLAGKRDL